jgi:hypothetical protein
MKQVTAQEFLKEFDADVHGRIAESLKRCSATFCVMFQNVDFCSSRLGDRTAVAVGEHCTYKSIEFCEGKWLGDLPSTRQYPQVWCDAKELIELVGKS